MTESKYLWLFIGIVSGSNEYSPKHNSLRLYGKILLIDIIIYTTLWADYQGPVIQSVAKDSHIFFNKNNNHGFFFLILLCLFGSFETTYIK